MDQIDKTGQAGMDRVCVCKDTPLESMTLTPEEVARGVAIYWAWQESENYRTDDFVRDLYLELRRLQCCRFHPSGSIGP